jgi:hypothetical protein
MEWKLAGELEVFGVNLVQKYIFDHKSRIPWHGIEHAPLRCEAWDKVPSGVTVIPRIPTACLNKYLENLYKREGKFSVLNLALTLWTRQFITVLHGQRVNSPIQWVGGHFPGVKRPGREADHSPQVSAEVKKMWIYTSSSHTPPCRFCTTKCWIHNRKGYG